MLTHIQKLCQFISKGPKYREPKQIPFEEAFEEIQTGIDQFIERISNDKGIYKNHFSKWKSHVVSSLCHYTLTKKLTFKSVKSIFNEHEVKNSKFSLEEFL